MRHPTDGVLRRLLDEPAAVADDDRRHLAGCAVCTSALDRAREDAQAAARALDDIDGGLAGYLDVDLDAAWARLSAAPPTVQAAVATPRRRRLRSPVAAAGMAAVVLLTGAGVAAANDWLPVFRTQQVAPVQVTSAELVQLPDFSGYGDMTVDGDPKPHAVADAAAARAASGLSLPAVSTLPDGVEGSPRYEVAGRLSGTFTFSAAKAAASAAKAGQVAPVPPAGLDGSRFRITAGPGAAAVWAGNSGIPRLVVARVTGPTVESAGVPFATVRDYLLSLPGVPADLAAQLRAVSADAATLPLPVPVDLADSSPVDVGGHAATLLTARSGVASAVVWVDGGIVTGVAGTVPAAAVVAVARGLR